MIALDRRPRIGLTTRRSIIGAFQTAAATPQAYVQLVLEGGGLPVLLPIFELPHGETSYLDLIKEMLDGVVGLLLVGGEDIHPKAYGQLPDPKLERTDPVRDEFDLALVRTAAARRLPMFGICRGLQSMNVGLGGTLIQHIDHHMMLGADGKPDSNRQHEVVLSSKSGVAGTLGVMQIDTNSYHHQCIDRVGAGLKIVGQSKLDGVPEVIEHEDRNYPCIGVQWHPEINPNPVSLRLMRWFVDQLRCADRR